MGVSVDVEGVEIGDHVPADPIRPDDLVHAVLERGDIEPRRAAAASAEDARRAKGRAAQIRRGVAVRVLGSEVAPPVLGDGARVVEIVGVEGFDEGEVLTAERVVHLRSLWLGR